MKYQAAILVILFSIFLSDYGVAQPDKKNSNILSVGYGFASMQTVFGMSNFKEIGYNVTEESGTGPIYIKYSYVFNGMGVGLNYATERREYISNQNGYTYKEVMENTTWQLRIDNVYDSVFANKNLILYWGLAAGYKDASWKYTSNDSTYNKRDEAPIMPWAMECTVGVRYHFSKYIGAFSEVGLAKSVFQFGICGKF